MYGNMHKAHTKRKRERERVVGTGRRVNTFALNRMFKCLMWEVLKLLLISEFALFSDFFSFLLFPFTATFNYILTKIH